ncbi:MAG: sterol desaturase family protein [Planctomycetota bacterium]|jgi:dihydroceramide fatty acyl 2-hydroxylase
MSAPEPVIDYEAALLPQVGALGDAYDAWVHRSRKPGRSFRIFRSGLFEAFSHIPWWLVLLVWVPVAVALWTLAVGVLDLPPGRAVLLAAGGLFVWTFVEYVLHRFVFHYRPRSAFGRKLHFLAHGIHHLDPWDPTRLVFPPLAGVVVAVPLFALLWLGLLWTPAPLPSAMAAMAGLLVGYLVYDMTHYYTHHGKPKGRWGKYLKAYHLAHHHKYWNAMFGVSQPLWDIVFRTGRPRS